MNWTKELVLDYVIKYPHILGHLVGKNKLSVLHSYWIKYIYDSPVNSSLQSHRGSYKTTSIAVGCVRHFLFFPNDRVAFIRKTFTDACDVVRTVSEIMKLDVIRSLFKFVHGKDYFFKTERAGLLTFSFKKTVTPEGSLTAHGIDASIVGKHYDKIIADDFVTVKDRLSRAEREKTKEVVRELQTNIIDPGKVVFFNGTPWERHDAWEIVPEPLRFTVHETGILTPEQIEDKRSKTTPSLFSANYELSHIKDDSKLFTNPKYGTWNYDYDLEVFAHIDTAFAGTHTCALTIGAKIKDDHYQMVGYVFKGNVKDWYTDIIRLYNKYNVSLLYVEDNADKGFTTENLTNQGLSVEGYMESMNKTFKIGAYLKDYFDRLLWVRYDDIINQEDAEWNIEYMLQLTDWAKGVEPDDAPDSASSLIKMAFAQGSKYSSLYQK